MESYSFNGTGSSPWSMKIITSCWATVRRQSNVLESFSNWGIRIPYKLLPSKCNVFCQGNQEPVVEFVLCDEQLGLVTSFKYNGSPVKTAGGVGEKTASLIEKSKVTLASCDVCGTIMTFKFPSSEECAMSQFVVFFFKVQRCGLLAEYHITSNRIRVHKCSHFSHNKNKQIHLLSSNKRKKAWRKNSSNEWLEHLR